MNTLWGARTNFSVGQSIMSVKTLLQKAKELGYENVALADNMSVSGLIDAARESKKIGVNLISGATLRVAHWTDEARVFQPKVYCKDGDAFVELLKAMSEAEVTGAGRTSFTYLTFDRFIEMLQSADFLVTTGDAHSAFSSAFPAEDIDTLLERVQRAQTHTHEQVALAIEVIAVDSPYYQRINETAIECSERLGLPLLVNGMAMYAEEAHAEARDVMEAISKNQRMSSPARNDLSFINLSMKSAADLLEISGVTPGSEKEFVASLNWKWSKMPISLPKMADDEFAALVQLCKQGWKDRIGSEVLGYIPSTTDHPEYLARLKMELGVLRELGFCGYFLLVADLVTWAKGQDILVGPGRGSVGGSLVAYLTGITDVDPIRFDLLFERFINPERLDLPDADLDFMSERRHEVVEYLREKYGSDCVAQISNYNTLGSPSALKEVGKAYELPDRDYACSSFIPKEHGTPLVLDEAVLAMPELQDYAAKHPDEFEVSRVLEGCIRSMGTHAAGVIVADIPIKTRAVVEARGEDGAVNWDKRTVEDMGLVKIDILGLTNLDVIRRAVDKVRQDYGTEVDLLKIPLDDPKIMKAFGEGNTVGIFQFESGGMRKLLKDLAKGGLLTFEDISAATALFRPGPLDSGMTQDYVSVRQGAMSPHYDHPIMETVLGNTNGQLVYQEQTMALARALCGFSGAEADNLRKAIGKKDVEKMRESREEFIQGAAAGWVTVTFEDGSTTCFHRNEKLTCSDGARRTALDAQAFGESLADWPAVHSIVVRDDGMNEDLANALFDKLEMYASYQFNKSHAIEYTIISYWTMYLKINYPHAFYAAALEVFKEDKLHGIVMDAAKRKIEILPPCINLSSREFQRTPDGHLMAPLNRIKGISETTENVILEAREKVGGKFDSPDHLRENVERRRCNIRHMQILEDVGAFANIIPDSLPPRHPDRTKTQLELLPGLIAANVRADRAIEIEGYVKDELTKLYLELRDEGAITLPRFGKKPKLMVITEAPTFHDEKAGKLMETDSAQFIKDSLKAAGLTMADCYFTTYLKKPREGKSPSNDEILFAKPYLAREIELVKPAVILALGSFVFRQLLPSEKGGIFDLNGKVIYDKTLDASIVIGISPGQLYHDPSKQPMLDDCFTRAAELFD